MHPLIQLLLFGIGYGIAWFLDMFWHMKSRW